LPLRHFAANEGLGIGDTPVAMHFAFFEASVGLQGHDANQPTPTGTPEKKL
jgi:hypothetical protein